MLLHDNTWLHSARIMQEKILDLAGLFYSVHHIHQTLHQIVSIFSLQKGLNKRKFSQEVIQNNGKYIIDWY